MQDFYSLESIFLSCIFYLKDLNTHFTTVEYNIFFNKCNCFVFSFKNWSGTTHTHLDLSGISGRFSQQRILLSSAPDLPRKKRGRKKKTSLFIQKKMTRRITDSKIISVTSTVIIFCVVKATINYT